MSIKFKAKFGATEIEYEGSEEFLKTELPQVVRTFSALLDETYEDDSVSFESKIDASAEAEPKKSGEKLQELAVGEIANKIDCKTGPDLALAACAYLDFVGGKSVFTRKEILEAMRTANSYYEENFSKNLTTTLSTMAKGDKLADRGSNKFALQSAERKRLEGVLAP